MSEHVPALEFRAVGKLYGSQNGATEALQDITFAVGAGEFLAVLGPSGCGKSTLLSLASGLEQPSDGEVSVTGQRVRGAVTDIGIVFQTDVLLEWRRILANVMLQIEMRSLDHGIYEPKARALLKATGLAGFENHYPHQLSGGMRQRVSICRAFVHDPPLLLMDEPFGALDALTRDTMVQTLHRLWLETKKSVLFVTHDIAEAVFLADRILVMTPRPGRVDALIDVDLPHPRTSATREAPRFAALVRDIRRLFERTGVLAHA